MTASARWEDLAARLASGIVLAAIGVGALWAGGVWIGALACVSVGVMMWEVSSMSAPDRPAEAVALGVFAAVLLAVILIRNDPIWIFFLVLPGLVGALGPRTARAGFLLVSVAMMIAGYAVVAFREGMGLAFVIWVVAVVAVVDLLGYFGGRLIGGPKFWPRLSPKKTWSGTASGWAGAIAVGAAFAGAGLAPGWTVPFSALVGFASQMGDIGESAVKRKAGVKDASHLIPGHGGLMDRFDGLTGALVFLILWNLVLPLPGVGG